MKPALPEVPTVDSEVTQIKAIQTDPKTGATEYTLTADSLIQNANGQDEMLVQPFTGNLLRAKPIR